MYPLKIFELDRYPADYILIGQLGSKSYGTSTPESDDDFMGVAIAPLSCYTGLDSWGTSGSIKVDRKETHNAELSVFELRKFLNLCLNFNPNVIPLLYLRPEDYEVVDFRGNILINNREAFTSRRAYDTMIGYARAQRKAVVDGDTGKLGLKRKELVKKYGYDVKYASHTIRILRMGLEFFDTNILNVYREFDKDELLEIRNGKLSLDTWLKMVDYLLMKAENQKAIGYLPEKPNRELVNEICMSLVRGIS
jgi:predicted nucleotidyltransferase